MSFWQSRSKLPTRILKKLSLSIFLSFAPLSAAEEQASAPLQPISPQYVQDYMGGMEALRQKDYEKAIRLFVRALDKNPDYPDGLAGLGLAYFQVGKNYLNQAGRYFRKALLIEPEHVEALELEGQYALMAGQITKAFKNYQTLRKLCDIEADDLKVYLDPILRQAQEVLGQYTPPKLPQKK
jgi:tetratricopeptide (TPR) repeat protein